MSRRRDFHGNVRISIMPQSEYQPGLSDTYEASLKFSSRYTPETAAEVRRVVLTLNVPAHYFLEGQAIGVLVPGPHPLGAEAHHRYYTIVQVREVETGVELEFLVRRCFYIDEVSGEQHPGIASNYLCDAAPGDRITITGPYSSPFWIPADSEYNLLMLGTGTGIAPFRAFLRRVYKVQKDWKGKIRLYYGARTGAEMLYMNEINDDLANYYDQETFQAFQLVRKNLLDDEGDALKGGMAAHAAEIWQLIQEPKTHVYLAGLDKIVPALDEVMSQAAGSSERWHQARQLLIDEHRWSELIYP